ncbi:MAG TPA: site-2 protease family protein [Clostridia bacterium]
MNRFEISYHLARILALLIALILHEIAHAVVALWNGDPTAKNAGRISLNPARHFDLLGLLMLLTLRFGYGKPVPINPYNFKNRRVGIFTVSIAGVTTNFLLAFISAGIYVPLLYKTGLNFAGAFGAVFLLSFFSLMVYINIFLMVFNLLPIYPLDGFRVVESFTRYNNRYVMFMRNYGLYILMGLFIISVLGDYLFPGLIAQYPFLDPLSYVITTVSSWIINPILTLWKIIWGVI